MNVYDIYYQELMCELESRSLDIMKHPLFSSLIEQDPPVISIELAKRQVEFTKLEWFKLIKLYNQYGKEFYKQDKFKWLIFKKLYLPAFEDLVLEIDVLMMDCWLISDGTFFEANPKEIEYVLQVVEDKILFDKKCNDYDEVWRELKDRTPGNDRVDYLVRKLKYELNYIDEMYSYVEKWEMLSNQKQKFAFNVNDYLDQDEYELITSWNKQEDFTMPSEKVKEKINSICSIYYKMRNDAVSKKLAEDKQAEQYKWRKRFQDNHQAYLKSIKEEK